MAEQKKNNVSINPSLNNPFLIRACRLLFGWYCKLVFTFYTPLKIHGKENLPETSSFLICANHNSHMDTAALGMMTCKTFNDLGALAARDYWFDRRVLKWLAGLMFHLIPIERKSSHNHTAGKELTIEKTLRRCAHFLKDRHKRIVFYPEGTRSFNGEMGTFKDGIAHFSRGLNVPILPIYLHGTFYAWGRNKFFIRPAKIQGVIGKPLYPVDFFGKDRNGNLQKKQTKKMMHELVERMKNLKRTIK